MDKRGMVRKALDRRRIAEEALRLIDAEGLEQLSMRRLGAALGVEGMALYYHFRNKGELLDAVLELLLEEMAPPERAMAPLDRLRRTFEACRQIAIRHPQAFLLVPTRRFRTDAQLDYYEKLLGIFRDAGFDAVQTATFFRILAAFVTGASLAEIGSRARQPDATPIRLEKFNDPERYPLVSAVVPHLGVSKLGAIFDFGMDLIFGAMNKPLAGAKAERSGGARGTGRRSQRRVS
jgi:AcrR family transcriptional regulator